MTTAAIRKLPTELPHARIYLDDLFEVEDLIREELSKLADAKPVAFEYEIDGALTITTREELIEHGGNASKFSLRLISPDWRFGGDETLYIYSTIRPRFKLPHVLRHNEWAIFGRVERIFAERRDTLKTLTDAIQLRHLIFF